MRQFSWPRHGLPLAAVQAMTPPAVQQLRLQLRAGTRAEFWERERAARGHCGRSRGFRSAHSTQSLAPRGLAHPRVPSEPGGSGSRAENSVRGGAGTRRSGLRSGSPASSAAAAPGRKRSPWKRSRAPRGAPPSPPPDWRAAAPARSRNRGVSCQRCEAAGWES